MVEMDSHLYSSLLAMELVERHKDLVMQDQREVATSLAIASS
jgi:hypothetical protein